MSRHSKVKSRTTRLQYSQWVLSLTLCLGHFTNNQKKKKTPQKFEGKWIQNPYWVCEFI